MDKNDEILNRIEKLPPAPQVLPRLLHALSRLDTDLSQIVDIISFDPALTVKLLQVCNSPVYRGAERVNDISEAVNRLGLRTVYGIVAAVVGKDTVNTARTAPGINAAALWRHSVTSAFAAQFVSEGVTQENGLVFTAALLHEIGQTILAEAFRKSSAAAKLAETTQGRPTTDQETQLFGVHHASVGARLLERWNFSPAMVAAVRFHHRPAQAGEHAPLAACVHLGDAIAFALDAETKGQPVDWTCADEGLEILQATRDDLPPHLERVKENLEYVEAMCRLQG